MFCSNCGHELKNGETHCPICGFPVSKKQVENPQVNAPVNMPMNAPVNPQVYTAGPVTPIQQVRGKKKGQKAEVIVLASMVVLLLLVAVFVGLGMFSHKAAPSGTVASGDASSVATNDSSTDSSDDSASVAADDSATVAADDSSSGASLHASPIMAAAGQGTDVYFFEKDGVLYNSLGLRNEDYKKNIVKSYFSADFCACAFRENETNELYYVKRDLSTEHICKGVGAGFNSDGSCMYYLTEDYELYAMDCTTFKSKLIDKNKSIFHVKLSPDGKYLCYQTKESVKGEGFRDVYVSTFDGEKVSFDTVDEDFYVEAVSCDGKKVYMQSTQVNVGVIYCLKNGEVSEIKGSKLNDKVVFDSKMDNALIDGIDALYAYSSETGESKEILSGGKRRLYLKPSYFNYITETLFDDRIEGCIVSKDDEYFWIDGNMNLVPLETGLEVNGCDFVAGSNGKYKFAYDDGEDVHLATFEKGKTKDEVLYDQDERCWGIECDVNCDNIWISNSKHEIYHITDTGSELIYQNPEGSIYGPVYDVFGQRLYFVASDEKLVYSIDMEGDLEAVQEDCEYVLSYEPSEHKIIFVKTDKTQYRIVGEFIFEEEQP